MASWPTQPNRFLNVTKTLSILHIQVDSARIGGVYRFSQGIHFHDPHCVLKKQGHGSATPAIQYSIEIGS